MRSTINKVRWAYRYSKEIRHAIVSHVRKRPPGHARKPLGTASVDSRRARLWIALFTAADYREVSAVDNLNAAASVVGRDASWCNLRRSIFLVQHEDDFVIVIDISVEVASV